MVIDRKIDRAEVPQAKETSSAAVASDANDLASSARGLASDIDVFDWLDESQDLAADFARFMREWITAQRAS